LGALRNLDHRPFDILAAVVFDEKLTVSYGALIPIDAVVELSGFSKHTNSHIFTFRRNTLKDPRVTEITAALSAC
jgi:hypothetical protein